MFLVKTKSNNLILILILTIFCVLWLNKVIIETFLQKLLIFKFFLDLFFLLLTFFNAGD